MKFRTVQTVAARLGRLPIRNARRTYPNPLLTDPTRTGLLRSAFAKHLRQQFALLKGKIVKLLLEDRALGAPTGNSFCPTGKGGGVDPTCGESTRGDRWVEGKDFTLERYDRGGGLHHVIVTVPGNQRAGGKVSFNEHTAAEAKKSLGLDGSAMTVEIAVVMSEGRGHGVGEAVYRKMASVAHDKGLRYFVSDKTTSDAAKALWRKLGGKELPNGRFYVESRELTSPTGNSDQRLEIERQIAMQRRQAAAQGQRGEAARAQMRELMRQREVVERELMRQRWERAREMVGNVFCATGPGGGVDATCSWTKSKLGTHEKFSFKTTSGRGFLMKISPSTTKSHTAYHVTFEDETGEDAVTGKGEAFEVFGKVISGLHEYVKTRSPDELKFTAAEPSRQKLYDRLVRKIAEVHPEYAAVGYTAGKGKGYAVVKRPLLGKTLTTIKNIDTSIKTEVLVNALSEFASDPDNVASFQEWLRQLMGDYLLSQTEEELWREYAIRGFEKGAGRAFDDAHTLMRQEYGYTPSREQFLRDSFMHPVSVDKVKLLAGRSFNELKNVTGDMSTKMTRALTDGLVMGKSPREIARDLTSQVDMSRERALVVARTEIVRAHAEGQLMALGKMGVEEVGVAIEWSTSGLGTTRKGYPSPCSLCAPMKGVVLKLDEAAGMIPRHPNCMCSWVPANVGESSKGQIRTAAGIQAAVAASHKAAQGKKSSKAKKVRKRKGRSATKGWGVGLSLSPNRPQSIVGNSFCATGAGGGVDPTCSSVKRQEDARETWLKFKSIAERVLGKNLNPFGGEHRTYTEDGRVIETSLHIPYDGKAPRVRIDFGYTNKKPLHVDQSLQPGTIDLAHLIKQSVEEFHDAGFAIEFGTSDSRRAKLYERWLMKSGLKLIERLDRPIGTQVWNVFCATGPGGGSDPTCSPGGSRKAFPHPSHVTVLKTLGGSTGAQLVQDEHGDRWVMKKNPSNPGHLRNEVQADDAYRALGVRVPHSGIVETPHGPVKFSRFHEGQTLAEWQAGKTHAERLVVHTKIAEGFAADAVLANWDVIGMQKDNILIPKDGVPMRIDNGGALKYRAQGALKGIAFGPHVTELDSMRQSSKNPSAKEVFGHVTDEQAAWRSKILLQKKADLLAAIHDPETKAILSQRLDFLQSKVESHFQLGGLLSPVVSASPPPPPPPVASHPKVEHPHGGVVPQHLTPQTATHLHSGQAIADYLKQHAATTGTTDLHFQKVAYANPEGVKGGVYVHPVMDTKGPKDPTHLEALLKVLPPGTVIKKKVYSAADLLKPLAPTHGLKPVGTAGGGDLKLPSSYSPKPHSDAPTAPKIVLPPVMKPQPVVPHASTPAVSPQYATILNDLAQKLSAVPQKTAASMFKTYKEVGYKHGFYTLKDAMKAGGLPEIQNASKMSWAQNAPKTSAEWKKHLETMKAVVAKSHAGGWVAPPPPPPKPKPPTVEVSDVHVQYGPFKFHQAKGIPDLVAHLVPIKSGASVTLPTWPNTVPEEMTQQWKASLTHHEEQAIISWKGSASGKRMSMVKQLRSGEWNSKSSAYNILSAIEKHPPVPGVFYRGVHGTYAKELFANAESLVGTGQQWAFDKAAHGMSMNHDTAVHGAGGASGVHGTLIRIASKSGRPLTGVGGFGDEAEVLNPPNTKYRVTGVYKDVTIKGTVVPRIIDLEEI